MRARTSLAWNVALLTILTLLVLTSVIFIFAAVQFRISPTNFIAALALNHVTAVAGDMAQDLAETPVSGRDELLSRLSKEYRTDFYLVDADGRSLATTPVDL